MALLYGAASQVSGEIILVPRDHVTIQAAIDAAKNDDEIRVEPGVYPETIDLLGKAITVRGVGGAAVTVLDGMGSGPVVRCTSGEQSTTVLEGLTITGGLVEDNGGGMLVCGASPEIRGCSFELNEAVSGGGLYVLDGNPTLSHCDFLDNTAQSAGGGIYNVNSNTSTIKCSFVGNVAVLGAGMQNQGGSPLMSLCVFQDNEASNLGGGIRNFAGVPQVIDCSFIGNTARDGGGLVNSLSNATVDGCDFEDNTVMFRGGGMRCFSGELSVRDCRFTNNMAGLEGGGIYQDVGSPRVTGCLFESNHADVSGGGAYFFLCDPVVASCRFVANTASGEGEIDGGGAMHLSDCGGMLVNGMMTGNAATSNGGAIVMRDSLTSMTHFTLVSNTASVGGAIHIADNAQPLLANSICWSCGLDPLVEAGGGVLTVINSTVQDGWKGAGESIMQLDPLFVDESGPDRIAGTVDDNLRLRLGSPAIDAGLAALIPLDAADVDGDGDVQERVSRDLDGSRRLQRCRVDQGAYERQGPHCASGIDVAPTLNTGPKRIGKDAVR